MDGFPVTFGVCPRCGRRGNMASTVNQPYQVEGSGEVGHGFELKEYRGQRICKWCIEQLQDDDESAVQVDLDNRDKELRAKLGYRKSYS